MELSVNPEPPEVMHIDLNSAFAMAEQQANPLLRGRPVGVTNRLNDFAICIAASYEAKRLGIGLGTRSGEARALAPNFVMVESDSAKYQHVNRLMRDIFASYSPNFVMKSVDEGVIDFRSVRRLLKGRSLVEVGLEIKQRVREEVGEYMKVNVGIGQNRWLAKVAAGFMKPDGLYVIDRENLETVYAVMDLVELPYIKQRTRARLQERGIFTTLDFYRAPEVVLTKQVFRSVMGHHWYLKLRGYETEVSCGVRTVGRSYVLEHRTADRDELAMLLYKACVKIARRMRVNGLAARGLALSLTYRGGSTRVWGQPASQGRVGWRERHMYAVAVWRADRLYRRALELFGESPAGLEVVSLYMTAYAVEPARLDQLTLYDSQDSRQDRVEEAVNAINDRYGELVVAPAAVLASRNPMADKVPFGSVRYLD